MEPIQALEKSYDTAASLLGTVTEDDLERPSPTCPEWDVQALVNHVVNALALFPTMVAGGRPEWVEDAIGDDPKGAFQEAATANLASWREGDNVDTPAGPLPGMKLVDINLMDVVMHTWDLAQALDTDVTFDAGVLELLYDRWQDAPLHISRETGAFGPEIEVPADAPVLDRLLGMTGRKPRP